MKKVNAITFLVCAGLLSGCANNPGLRNIGSTILSSTGVMTGTQADALFSAGQHAVKGFDSLNEEQEYYLGRGVAATVLSRYRPLRNAGVNNYVNKVGNVVAAYSDRPAIYKGYHFMVLDSNELNAFAAPGGFIFVTKGLVRAMPDEDALAAVLAHEMGHVVKAHGLNAIRESNLTQALVIIGKEAASEAAGGTAQQLTNLFGDSIKDMVSTLIDKGYSRGQEYDADEYAVGLLKRAGYNPNALVSMLENLDKHESRDDGATGLESTHPDASDRIDEVKSDIGTVTVNQEAQNVRAARFRQAIKSLG